MDAGQDFPGTEDEDDGKEAASESSAAGPGGGPAGPAANRVDDAATLRKRHEKSIREFCQEWGLKEETRMKMGTWNIKVVEEVIENFAPHEPLRSGGSWDGKLIMMARSIMNNQAAGIAAPKRKASDWGKVAPVDRRAERRPEGEESQVGEPEKDEGAEKPRETFFEVTQELRDVMREWLTYGPSNGVVHDFVHALDSEVCAKMRLGLAIREAQESRIAIAKYVPTSELDAYSAYVHAELRESECREGNPIEVRFPFGRHREVREADYADRRETIIAVAQELGMSFEEARRYFENRRRSALMPISDWRTGFPDGGGLPSRSSAIGPRTK